MYIVAAQKACNERVNNKMMKGCRTGVCLSGYYRNSFKASFKKRAQEQVYEAEGSPSMNLQPDGAA